MLSPDLVFTIANAAVLPFWLLLVFVPHASVTNTLVHSGLIPVLYGVLYTTYIGITMVNGGPEGGGMGSLGALQIALSAPDALVAAWVHYLVFDLFVGAWMTRDAKRHGIMHVAIVIPLILTLMAGPLGLLLYIALRAGWKQRFTLNEAEPV